MNVNLFIDTNVYLTFYHFTSDDLEELNKLIVLINSGNVRLYLPEQTRNEFYRNREVKISDSLDKLRSAKLNNQFPRICHSYSEFTLMTKAIKQFESNKSKLLDKLQHDAESTALKADDVIEQLFSKAKAIVTSQQILSQAVTRFNIGNPPGKDKSYGDAINWESLLAKIPSNKDLHFISEDKDFYSQLNSSKFNSYLLREWKEKKDSKLIYYKRLSEFFKSKFPDIEISSDTEKDIVIKNLVDAYSFENAKLAIRRLRNYDNFSVKQLNDIAEAFSSNNQIYWIQDDSIVRSARQDIIDPNLQKLEKSILKDFKAKYD